MKIHLQIALSFGLLLSSMVATAQVACVSGTPEKNNLITQLHYAKAKSSITDIIYKQYQLGASTQAKADCTNCSSSLEKRPEDLSQVASSIQGVPSAPKLLFNPDCLKETAEYKIATKEVACPTGERTKNICQTQEIVTYQNAVVSSFLSCVKKLNLPSITPSALYKIYALESGFKPQFASKNGMGLGQLTSIFIDDVHQPWRGGGYLNKIANSDLKECEAAKILAQKDLKSKPSKNACSYIQLGEGMERNILYTFVGLATAWEKDLLPIMKNYMQKHANHPSLEEVKNLTMATAYSSGGRAAGRAIASRLSGLSPEAYLKAIKKPMARVKGRGLLNPYVINMDIREKELGTKLADSLKADFDKQGVQACINQ